MSHPNTERDERVRQIRANLDTAKAEKARYRYYEPPTWDDIDLLLSLLDSQVAGACGLEFEAKLLGFPNERDQIKLCEPCLLQAIADNFVIFSSAIPREQQPRPTSRDFLGAEMGHLNNPQSDWPYGHRFQRREDGSSKCLCGFTLTPSDATRMRDRCVERVKRKADCYQRDSERSDYLPNYRKNMALVASALREVVNDLQSLTLDVEV